MKILTLILLLVINMALFAQPIPTGVRLKDIGNDFLIGATNPLVNTTVANREFNLTTSLWYPAWGGWNGPGSYNFDNLNSSINWSVDHEKKSMMHMFVGQDFYLPSWFIEGTWTNSEMDDMLKDMIYQTLESNSNKTKLDYINVANELFNDDGTYRNMKWNQLGWESDVSGIAGSSKINAQHPVFVGKAFQYCRDKTNAILELRDYWNEVTIEGASYNLKYKAFYQLAKHLITKGYPINAVGIQGHYDIGNINWFVQNEGLKKAVTNYKDLGLAVYITEIDLGISEWSTPKTWSSDAANQQKEDMITVLTQMIYGGATIINFWGIRDGADQGWRPDDHPLLFDEQFSAKPVYYGVQQVLNDAKVSQPTSSKPGSKEISSKEISFVGNQKILIGTQESFGGSSNLVITDIQGKTVFSQSIDNTEAEIIEPQRLSSGLYLVFIKSRSGIQSYKMVIQ